MSTKLLERLLFKAEHGYPPFQEQPGSRFKDVVDINEFGVYVTQDGSWVA